MEFQIGQTREARVALQRSADAFEQAVDHSGDIAAVVHFVDECALDDVNQVALSHGAPPLSAAVAVYAAASTASGSVLRSRSLITSPSAANNNSYFFCGARPRCISPMVRSIVLRTVSTQRSAK